MPLRDAIKYLCGALLAIALMAWVLRGTDPATLWAQIRNASILGLLLGGTLNIGHNVFRVLRWGVLLEPVKSGIPFRSMFVAVILGYMTSWIVPGRLGELVRPMLVSAREGVALGPAVGSVVADRVLDVVSVALLFGLGLLITPLSGSALEHATLLKSGAVALTLGALGLLTVMVLASRHGDRLSRWVSRRGKALAWFGRACLSLARGAGALGTLRGLALSLIYSLLAWITIAAGTWCCVRASGADLSFGAVLVVLPMLVLGVAVPTPGGAGSYHGAMKTGLMLFGVSEITAVSAGILTHVMITVPIIVVGVLLLWTEKVRWGDLVSGARQFRTLGDEPAARLQGVS